MIVDSAVYEEGRRDGQVTSARRAASPARSCGSACTSRPPEEFDSLTREFDLHPLAVEDAIHAHQRPKLEVLRRHAVPRPQDRPLRRPRRRSSSSASCSCSCGHDYVITVRHGEASSLAAAREALERDPERHAPRPGGGAARDRRPRRGRLRARRSTGSRTTSTRWRSELFSGRRAERRRSGSTGFSARCSSSGRAIAPLVDPVERLAARPVPARARGGARLLPRRERPPDPRARPARRLRDLLVGLAPGEPGAGARCARTRTCGGSPPGSRSSRCRPRSPASTA